MLRFGLFFLLVLVAFPVQAADVTKTISFVPPTEYVDETPLSNADISDYPFRCGSTSGGPYGDFEVFVTNSPPNLSSFVQTLSMTEMDWFCVISARVSVGGVFAESPGTSNEVQISHPLPGAPTALSAN